MQQNSKAEVKVTRASRFCPCWLTGSHTTTWTTESQDASQPLCFYEMATEIITMSLSQHTQPEAHAVISWSVQAHPGIPAAVLFIQGQRARYLKRDHMKSFIVALKGGGWLKIWKVLPLNIRIRGQNTSCMTQFSRIIQADTGAKVNSSCVLTWSIVT